jgi:class 3 adenylate cyclase/tetratricopeptide (TPR) repeat protein
MRCPKCRADNPADSLFCTECGARIETGCAACGAINPPAAKFCRRCGAPAAPAAAERSPNAYTPRHLAERILTTRGALEGERKRVTVLFADVKGSMELAGQIDVEAWHAILERFFGILTEGVHRFEGTVNQYTGDGIMALFGAPIAHEDHAHRACYAALHLREALRAYAHELRRERGLSFAVRMGLNSGEVVVGKIGDDLRMDYTAQGHTVGLAARMQELAEAGTVYLTEHTAALVGGYMRLEDLGAFTVKSVREPVRVFELQGLGALRTRLDVSRARGFSRFVGRAKEIATLEAALEQALAGSGQVVGVVGEAGLGKSRLCFEFVERCRARGLWVYEGRGVAHGKMMPFLPVLDLLRSYFGVGEQDDARTAREKIAGRLLLLDPNLTEGLPLLFDFLGVPDPDRPAPRMDPEARQRQLFAVTRRLIHAINRREPGFLLFEDLHWLDGGSEAFVENHVEALAGTRGFLLVNFRPEYRAAWMTRSYYQQIPLAPLGPEAISELLSDLLGGDPSLAGLADRIRERTGGNPFFTEEVVQALIESGRLVGSRGAYRLVGPLQAVAIPATVQAILAARIDRLGEREKGVLQTAAVIGKEFAEPVLRRVANEHDETLAAALRALVGAEFLYEEALYPEAEYTFKHPLTQEVAYLSQLAERRALVHAAVARVVSELYADRLDERAALLAHHWERAGDALEAARWHRRAAEWAGVNDPGEALRHWQRVRVLLETVPESAETVDLGLVARFWLLQVGWRLGVTAEEAATLFAEGKALAERNGNLRLLAPILTAYGAVRGVAGDVEGYLALASEAVRVAVQTGEADLVLATQPGIVYSHFVAGRLRQALAFTEAAVAQGQHAPQQVAQAFSLNPYLFCLWWRGSLRAAAGRLDEAARDLDDALRLAREQGEIENLGWVHGAYVMLAEYCGETGSVLEHARQLVEIAERMGSSFSRVFAYRVLGLAHLLREEWSEAVGPLEQALAIARERGVGREQEPIMLTHLARAAVASGEATRARAAAEEAVALARRLGTRFMECAAQTALAHVLLRTDEARSRDAIEAALVRALDLVEETGGKAYEPFVRLERTELARVVGDEAAQRRELRVAYDLFVQMGATAWAVRVAAALPTPPRSA